MHKTAKTTITCSESAASAIRPAFPKRVFGLQECFAVLCLDTHNRSIGRPQMISMGTAARVDVHPRDVFRIAIRRNAVGIIVAHNHPSGVLELSDEDLALTKRLHTCGETLGIPLLDHIVLGTLGYISLADRKMLQWH